MLRLFVPVFLFAFLTQSSIAQLKSPEEFLGYKIGTKFTPHWKIVDYFKAVATAVPNSVKLEQYGQTNEGRPLMVAYVSNDANISNLENIRRHNLYLAKQDTEENSNFNYPAIVWLSYNVHGNEASSSEASMLTLYALVDPKNAQTKQWLKNTLVVIDPCINPDGRDRHVNWLNNIVGKNFNPSTDAREHFEPWPGGRTNHYNFDLNRDWAWQTQIETQSRMVLYNKWLPQVHVDFHEMGIDAPYFFAPAAQPFHEVVTKWQRDFQSLLGKNNAKYFDQNGWLYFTRENYDLLYPSYGDTYPTYNGAIGVTYEQAGGGGGGRAGGSVTNSLGDTLSLFDRVIHHYTTSLSTIEVASQNASKLVAEFQKFYTEAATSGIGNYKSYVIKYNPDDAARIQSLTELLDKNKIFYGTTKTNVSYKGFNYDSRKEESFSIASNDIVISGVQPKSALVKVLFEPNTVLVDTVAYDITAWSLPYVFGLKAYASTQKIDAGNAVTTNQVNNNLLEDAGYGYVIRWNGMQTVKLVSQLLQKGIKLRYNERPFETNGQSFNRGAVLVLKASNQYIPDLWKTVRDLANRFSVPLTTVTSGMVDKGYDFGSTNVHPIKRRRIALLTGEGVSPGVAGEIWFYFDQIIGYPITLINASNAANINWSNYDVVILPDGYYRFFNEKNAMDQFRSWINKGGHLIAIGGAVAQLSKQDWALKMKNEDTADSKDIYASLRKFEERDRAAIPSSVSGAIFRVDLDNTNPLAFGYPDHYYTLKIDENVYEFIKEDGWNVGVLKKEKPVEGFVGSKIKNRFQDGLLFGVQELDDGTITYLADDVLFRSFWENGKLMFANAVFLVGQ
jgi:hypothetical protein